MAEMMALAEIATRLTIDTSSVKIGFADNVEKRLGEHRTAAPTAKVLKAWPCNRSWDYAAMDSITRDGCKPVLNKVHEGDINGFLERAEKFFYGHA